MLANHVVYLIPHLNRGKILCPPSDGWFKSKGSKVFVGRHNGKTSESGLLWSLGVSS